MASVLETIAFDPASFQREMAEFETLLLDKAALSERDDLQPFFKAHKNIVAYMGHSPPTLR